MSFEYTTTLILLFVCTTTSTLTMTKKRGEKKIDKVQISFQFGWCDVNVICDGNKGSIKHRTERERKREKCYAATYIYSYLQYHTHMMLLYTKRSASHRSCAVHVTWKNIL